MRIATFNVNSIRVRQEILLAWLKTAQADVVCLQEIKCLEFPAEPFQALGYHVLAHGQKTYNGVAILSRTPITPIIDTLPGDPEDPQVRYLEARIQDVRIASIYLPNGNPVDTPKYPYKLAWMKRLRAHVAQTLLPAEEPLVLAGDYNLIPEDRDCHAPDRYRKDALMREESRHAFRSILNLGLYDAWRSLHPETIAYSYWDYMAERFTKNHGLRIDHLLLNAIAMDRLTGSGIDTDPRGQERPSDHTPVWVELT